MNSAQSPISPRLGSTDQVALNGMLEQGFVLEYWQTVAADNPRREWCWRLRTLTGATIAYNQGFASLGDCLLSIRQLRHAMVDAAVIRPTPRDY